MACWNWYALRDNQRKHKLTKAGLGIRDQGSETQTVIARAAAPWQSPPMSKSLRCARDDSVGEGIATALRPRTTHLVWVQGPSSPTSYPAPCTREKREDSGGLAMQCQVKGSLARISS